MSLEAKSPVTVELKGVLTLDASAGTGKTYSIALIHLRLILSGTAVERILVTTFTEAAAAELRERLRKRLTDARDALTGEPTEDELLIAALAAAEKSYGGRDLLLRRVEVALSCFDLAPVCTIHGFCHRLLRDHALELGADPEGELGAVDPRIARMVGDYEAKMADLGSIQGDDSKKPDTRDSSDIARTVREYALEIPAQGSLDQMLAGWKIKAETTLKEAKAEWTRDKQAIDGEIRSLVRSGALKPEIYDKGSTAPDTKRWTKLENSLDDVDELLKDTGARDLKFATGVSRLLPQDLLASAEKSGLAEVSSFIEGHPFFKHWAGVEALGRCKKTVYARSYLNELLKLAAELKPDRNLLFSDLINAVYRNLKNGSFIAAVRGSLDAVLVDECQDVDGRQLSIFSSLFSDKEWSDHHFLVWVGDPKQSIYRFRGADIDTYIAARKGASENLPLAVNFRSDPGVVAAVNALFKGPGVAGGRMFGVDIDFEKSEASKDVRIRIGDGQCLDPLPAFCLHMWKCPGEAPLKNAMLGPVMKDCADQIEYLLKSGVEVRDEKGAWHRVKASDIAVLTSRHHDLTTVRRTLRKKGIASAYRTDSSVFLEDEARDLQLLLKALAGPRLASLKGALLTPFFGYTPQEVEKLTDEDTGTIQARLASLAEHLNSEGFMSVLSSILREAVVGAGSALERLAADPEGERILTNIIQLGELLQQAWMGNHARTPVALKDYLDQAVAKANQHAAGEAGEESMLRLETDSPAVILSTIHAAKGLQYPVVFLPAIWAQKDASTPSCIVSRKPTGDISLILPGDADWDNGVKLEASRLEAEQMRLLYVACTRAKHQVHAWWGRVTHYSGANVASTNAAFGQLLLPERREADGYTDDQCAEAFKSAMARDDKATSEIVLMRQRPAWAATGKVADAVNGEGGGEISGLDAAEWRRGSLSAAPLQASYSALLRRNPVMHRGDDEPVPSGGDGDQNQGGSQPAPEVDDVLEPFRAGRVLGDRVHCALEAAMSAGTPESGGKLFKKAIVRDLHLLLLKDKGDGAVGPVSGKGSNAKPAPDPEQIAGQLWEKMAGAVIDKAAFGDLLGQPHAPEWAFLLPQQPSLNPTDLTETLKKYGVGSPWGNSAYADRVRRLAFVPLSGYFEGIVDLVARLPGESGRWVVIDYKTNRLEDGYGADELAEAMADSHYLLQALLYSVAVTRWMEKSVPGWDYEKHFAGAAYMFLRGLKKGSDQGVWLGKPPKDLVVAVDHLLCGGVGKT